MDSVQIPSELAGKLYGYVRWLGTTRILPDWLYDLLDVLRAQVLPDHPPRNHWMNDRPS